MGNHLRHLKCLINSIIYFAIHHFFHTLYRPTILTFATECHVKIIKFHLHFYGLLELIILLFHMIRNKLKYQFQIVYTYYCSNKK